MIRKGTQVHHLCPGLTSCHWLTGFVYGCGDPVVVLEVAVRNCGANLQARWLQELEATLGRYVGVALLPSKKEVNHAFWWNQLKYQKLCVAGRKKKKGFSQFLELG